MKERRVAGVLTRILVHASNCMNAILNKVSLDVFLFPEFSSTIKQNLHLCQAQRISMEFFQFTCIHLALVNNKFIFRIIKLIPCVI